MIKRLPKPIHALPIVLTGIGCLGLVACDKIKEVADDVKSKVGETLEDRLEEPVVEVKVNPLMALVDQNEQGVVFRKDMGFPDELKVVTSFKQKIEGRIFIESELGRKTEIVNGKESITAQFERKGSTVVYHIVDTSYELPPPPGTQAEGEGAAKPIKAQNPFRQAPPPTKPMTFARQAEGWKGKAGGDFKLMAMSQQLSPVFGDLLIENSVMPRPLWFSSSRVKVGDEIELSGASLPMIVSGNAKGRIKLKLEKIEDVNDHPCGLFSVSGEFSRSNFPNPEGRLLDQEVTIESGELWLSLLYPVILKEKLKTIQTFKPSEGAGSRGQGTIDTLVIREWTADIPLPEPEPVETQEQPTVEQPTDEAAG